MNLNRMGSLTLSSVPQMRDVNPNRLGEPSPWRGGSQTSSINPFNGEGLKKGR
ncbi:hypothetical protein IC007_2524 [Sulfuracidifex tepidarius]|uniref:Uncharacterized protein n=1 Tax=Sulfuracidifex tepidarius TaxID=1294262 RepID=A0A510E633_9CREN|nr:hypothetical protein IC007_2524 [Sulfuracidifex tepidarius]